MGRGQEYVYLGLSETIVAKRRLRETWIEAVQAMTMLREGDSGLLRAAIASILLHALLLQAIPIPEGPGASPQARIRARLVQILPAVDSRTVAPPPITRPLSPSAAQPRAAPPPSPRVRHEVEPQALPPAIPSTIAQSAPVEQPLSPEQQSALRGLRISLALALGGQPVKLAVSCRAVARMRYLAGGRLAALALADSDCPEEVERWLIAHLLRAIDTTRIPDALQHQSLELELAVEFGAE
jgi:hypothetical protein